MRLFLLALLLLVAPACAKEPARDEAPAAEAPAPPPPPPTPAPVPQELFDAVEASPRDAEALRRLAIALHDAGRREEALVRFEKLVALAPDPRHLLDLALAYASASRPREAEATY